MENEKQQKTVPENLVAYKIYNMRDRRIILDKDLAELYEVETKVQRADYQLSDIMKTSYIIFSVDGINYLVYNRQNFLSPDFIISLGIWD